MSATQLTASADLDETGREREVKASREGIIVRGEDSSMIEMEGGKCR